MPFLHRDRFHALRLTFVVVWVLVPLAVLLAYSYALLAGATAVTLGVIARNDLRFPHQGLVSGFVTLVIVVSLMR